MKHDGNAPLTPEDNYATGERPAAKKSRVVQIVVALFFLANIIVLYILHFANRGTPSSADVSMAVTASYKSSGLAASSPKAGKGLAVSLDANGELRVGAGTTAYLDIAELPENVGAVHFTPLGVSKGWYSANIMSYQTGVGTSLQSTVTIVEGNVGTKKVSIAAADDKNIIKGGAIKGLATLSDTTATVLYGVTSSNGMTVTPYAVPASIADGKVQLDQDAKVEITKSSATTFITRLSDSTFASAFYEPYVIGGSWKQRVSVGTIGNGKIKLSDSVVFGAANDDNSSTTIGQPLAYLSSGDRFVVPWFVDGPASTGISAHGGLCLTTFKFDAKSANLTAATPACDAKYQPAYFVDTAKLSDTKLVFAFADSANRYALTVVTVEFSAITGKATFRGSYVFDDATGAYDFGAVQYGFYPKPTVRVLSNNRIAVGFLNPSSAGKPSIKILKFSADGSISAASPAMPLANADFTLASADPQSRGAIVVDMVPLETGVVVAYAGNFASTQQQRISFVESYGKPIGVISSVDGSDLNVAVSGSVDVSSSLTTGKAYYGATDGKLYAPSTTTNDNFVLANDDKIVLSKDSFVGVAVSGKSLLVATQSN